MRGIKKWAGLFVIADLLLMALLTGCTPRSSAAELEPPAIKLSVDGASLLYKRGGYEWKGKNKSVIADAPSPYQLVKDDVPFTVKPSSKLNIDFEDSPEVIWASLWEGDAEGKTLEVQDHTLSLPKVEGIYMYAIHAKWEKGNAVYAIKIQVKPEQLEDVVLAEATIGEGTSKGRKLLLRMTDGVYREEQEPGPYEGGRWEGKFQLDVLDEQTKLVAGLDLNKGFQEELLSFHDKFDITFADYNGDGNPDFSIGQYASSNLYTYLLFTVTKDGISQLPIKGVPDLFSSQRTYSPLFTKVNDTTIKTSFYDNSKGQDVEQSFSWTGEAFELLEPSNK
ncbi:hypothetical protein [Paenibacillus eucommiae]|uniref:Lipoprotein n=1 Tax=Paenibacillus eucommiae TaxID=1355755 RepID=A0ABS4ITH5_9BACL|nr:hypothetical protein [Paenibacillus eucommiae]MBP1990874.1 hypothetical protein [Paenibacillus eucommiae]